MRWYEEALRLRRELGDPGEIANALYNRAYADMIVVMTGGATMEETEASRQRLEEALEIYRDLGDTGGEGNVVWGLGSFYYFLADAPTAETWFRRSLELHRAAGDRTMEAWSLHMIALALIGQRRSTEARTVARHGLEHFHEAGDISGVTLVLDDLALIEASDGQGERAGRLWGAARRLQAATGTALADYVEETDLLFGVPTPRAILGDARLEELSAEGAVMGLDEVVAYALDGPAGATSALHEEPSMHEEPA